jgi:hypothetical protein
MHRRAYPSAAKRKHRASARSLRDLLRNRMVALEAEAALRLLQGVARGMAFLHARSGPPPPLRMFL